MDVNAETNMMKLKRRRIIYSNYQIDRKFGQFNREALVVPANQARARLREFAEFGIRLTEQISVSFSDLSPAFPCYGSQALVVIFLNLLLFHLNPTFKFFSSL